MKIDPKILELLAQSAALSGPGAPSIGELLRILRLPDVVRLVNLLARIEELHDVDAERAAEVHADLRSTMDAVFDALPSFIAAARGVPSPEDTTPAPARAELESAFAGLLDQVDAFTQVDRRRSGRLRIELATALRGYSQAISDLEQRAAAERFS